MKNTLISIIIPVYNTEKYLAKCLNSILCQTYNDWEAILVDDGSKDESGKICDDYATKDNRFKVIHKPNEGVSIARLIAFNHCSGQYITFVDSDDYVTDDILEKMYGYIQEYDVDMVVCGNYNVYGTKIVKDTKRITGFFDRNGISQLQRTKLIYDYTLGMPPIIEGLARRIIKKELLQDTINKSVGYWSGEDAICNLNLYEKVRNMFLCDDCLYYYVHREGAASRSNAIKLWNGNIELFRGIVKINHDGIYDSQLFGRLIMTVKISLANSGALSFVEFKKLMEQMVNSPEVQDYILEKHKSKLLLFKDKFAYYILTSKCIYLKYILVKILTLYRRYIKKQC